MLNPQDIHDFWFGPLQSDGTATEPFHRRWFGGGPQFDEEIRMRFGPALAHALVWLDPQVDPAASPYREWLETPKGRLAAIVMLDQFPRNLYRRQAQAFSGDAAAQKLCWDGIALGHDRQLSGDERVFFYLPLEHGESREWQERSLAQFQGLLEQAPSELKPRYENFLRYAQAHADIIFRFGRYPHRNEALGRTFSQEETEFMKGPGSSFW